MVTFCIFGPHARITFRYTVVGKVNYMQYGLRDRMKIFM
jgi:hypothetical protein